MRKTIHEQLTLPPPLFPFSKAREYEEISRILNECPAVTELVLEDLLAGGIDPAKGREGLSADQVLRAKILRQREGFSYEDLAFQTAANEIFRQFCRLEPGQTWTKSRLHRNLAAVSAETLEKANRLVLGVAAADGIEDGQRVAVDPTGVKTNVHEPSDSALLWDVVRVLNRFMHGAVNVFVTTTFKDQLKQAGRLSWRISNAKGNSEREPLYEKLVRVAGRALRDARRIATKLEALSDPGFSAAAGELARVIHHVVALGRRVVDQTKRRVFEGETVPAQEKILSIFEPHTDLLAQGQTRVYGHKVTFTSGVSGMILDAFVEQGNPNDTTLALRMIDRLVEIYGRPPKQVVYDGGFTSADNLKQAKARGVRDVVFTKAKGLKIKDMVDCVEDYESLRCFRTGVERAIGFLKQSFGLDCCPWSGLPSFKAYVWTSVLSANLLVLARRRLAKERLEAT
jgi:IS5 family transposase